MIMSRLTRLATTAVGSALAIGLSACAHPAPVTDGASPEPDAGTSQAPSQTPSQTPTTDSGIRDIVPITFEDTAIGLTHTCDQIITDFPVASTEPAEPPDTIVLMFCTITTDDYELTGLLDIRLSLERTGDTSDNGMDEETVGAGPAPTTSEGEGRPSVDGWLSVESPAGEPVDVADGTWKVVYERDGFESSKTGLTYESYSQSEPLTIM